MIRLDEGNETVSRISFWEIYNSNMPKTREESLIIKNSQKLIDFIEKKILTCSEFSLFRELVDENEVEDYYDNIPISMSISNIIEKLKNSYYLSERAFLFDLNLIALNSERFNGAKSPITFSARKLVERLKSQIQIRERSALEKQIDIGIDEEFLNRKRQRREVASNSKENIEKEIVKSAKKSRRKVNSYESVDKENNSDGFEPNEASEINSSLRLMVDLPIHMGRQTRNSMRGININGNSENRRILRSTKLN